MRKQSRVLPTLIPGRFGGGSMPMASMPSPTTPSSPGPNVRILPDDQFFHIGNSPSQPSWFPGARKRGGQIEEKAKKGKWIKGAINPENKGKLHRELGVPQEKRIPQRMLNKATHDRNPTIAKEARLAKTLKSFHHRKM
jgi:hypothetical protein